MLNKLTIISILGFISFSYINNASATGMSSMNLPINVISIGPSISTFDKNLSANIDTSWTLLIFTSSINIKYIRLNNTNCYGFQSEFTLWLIINFGGGFGQMYGSERGQIKHLFFGLPLNLTKMGAGQNNDSRFPGRFVEPYVRINYFNNKHYIEAGIYYKVQTKWNDY
jgi:hypothetical protein